MAQTKNQHPDGIDNEHTRCFLIHESPEEENSHKNGEKLSKKLPAERRIINRNVPAGRNFNTTEKETEKGKENEMRKKREEEKRNEQEKETDMEKEKEKREGKKGLKENENEKRKDPDPVSKPGKQKEKEQESELEPVSEPEKEKEQESRPVSESEKEKGRKNKKGKERGKGFMEKQTAEKEDSGKARSQKYLQIANPEEPILRKTLQKSAGTDGYNIKQEQDRKQKQQKHRQEEQRERTNKPARDGKQEYGYKRNEERKFGSKQEGRRVREYEPAYGQTNESERRHAGNRKKKDGNEHIQRCVQDPLYEYIGKQGYENEQTYGQDHETRHLERRRYENGHDDGHGSRHAHGHSHTHQIGTLNRAFILGITLNTLFVAAEFIAGFMSDSMGLISDAGHNLSDVASLILAMIAFKLSKVAANSKYTYGYRRSTILVSLLNAIILLIAVGIILAESIDKLFHPRPVEGGVIIWVAGIGVIINAATAWLFLKDKEKDLNVKGAYLHMAADALVSVGVVISGIVILTTGWYIIDPIIGILIALIIVYSTWGLLRDSLVLSLDGVPASIRTEEIEKDILTVPGVTGLHHLHIWAISTTETALTAHIVISTPARMEAVKCRIKQKLAGRGIGHATLEIESPDSPCEDR